MIEKYGEKFRITKDECGDPKIECGLGFVYEIGEKTLGAWLESKAPNKTAATIKAKCPESYVTLQGDHELIIAHPCGDDFRAGVVFLKALKAQDQTE